MKTEDRNKIIDECIKAVKAMIHPNCDGHTPFRGVCCSCDQVNNYDVLDPEAALQALNNLKAAEPKK